MRLDFDIAEDGNGNARKFYAGVDDGLGKGVPRGATVGQAPAA